MDPSRPIMPVIIAEDHRDLRTSIAAVLSDEGYDVFTAEDGNQALSKVLEMNEPCLIFLDLTMPRCDGREFLKKLDEYPETKPKVQIVLMSGLDDAEEFAERQDLVFLKKPVGVRAMLEIANQLCRP